MNWFQLQLGELDFAIAPLDAIVGKPDLVGETLFYDRCGLFVDANHPLARRWRGQHRAAHEVLLALFERTFSLTTTRCVSRAQSRGWSLAATTITSTSVIYLNAATIGSEFIGNSIDGLGWRIR